MVKLLIQILSRCKKSARNLTVLKILDSKSDALKELFENMIVFESVVWKNGLSPRKYFPDTIVPPKHKNAKFDVFTV